MDVGLSSASSSLDMSTTFGLLHMEKKTSAAVIHTCLGANNTIEGPKRMGHFKTTVMNTSTDASAL